MNNTGRGTPKVVVIGSGVAGALVAHSLASRGTSVTVLEAGPRLDRAEAFARFTSTSRLDSMAPYPDVSSAPSPDPSAPDDYIIREGYPYAPPQYIRAVGGTTWHWSGVCLRIDRDDLELRSRYGLERDWPIAHDDLDAYYDAAERELGVSGSDLAPDTYPTPTGSSAYVMPPTPPSYSDRRLVQRLRSRGLHFRTTPAARNSVAWDGRPACRGNNMCSPLCPIGAQYAAVVHVEKAEKAGAHIIENALVMSLSADRDGKVTSAKIRRPDGSHETVSGDYFILAANGIETPRIALQSASEEYPQGIANSSGLVGRNFMDNLGLMMRFEADEDLHAGRGPVAGPTLLDDGNHDFRTNRTKVGIGLENRLMIEAATVEAIRYANTGIDLDRNIRRRAAREVALIAFVETLPKPENRIVIEHAKRDVTGLPRIKLQWRTDSFSDRGIDYARSLGRRIAEGLGSRKAPQDDGVFAHHHLMGTMRMGREPTESVVDPSCRSHDHQNLFVAGSSVFPTGGGAKSPTLTIAALALRVADEVTRQIRQN